MIQLKNISKTYGDNFGLSDINIKIEDGEFLFLVGPSGAGKSTFIKLILKEIDPDEGEIFFDDMEITSLSNRLVPVYRRNIGIVFQDFRLLPKKTVYENVAFAMEAVHQKKRLIKKQVPHILKLVGISEKADRYPAELSGGEAQRVAIARAIVNNPKVLIADEPTGNLDPEKSWEIMNLLHQINLRGTTIVMVTHAKDIVDKMGKRVIQIEHGRIVRDDTSGFYVDDPATLQSGQPGQPVQDEAAESHAEPSRVSTPENVKLAEDALKNAKLNLKAKHIANQKREEQERALRQQEKMRRLGIKATSDDTKRFTTEELIREAEKAEKRAEQRAAERKEVEADD